jgi:hypothetical protein
VRRARVGGDSPGPARSAVGLARLQGFRGPAICGEPAPHGKGEGVRTVVKKLLLLALVGLGVFAVWRKVQADRAELDLWTEATTDE